MNSINFFKTRRGVRRKEKMKVLRKLICLFFILVFLLNFLSIETNNYQNFINEKGISKNELLEENQERYERTFSRYLSKGLKPEQLPEYFDNVRNNLLNAER